MLISIRKLLQQQTDSVCVRILDSILDLNAPDSAGFQWFPPDRVGGGVTPAVLSHHRTYGSVYGGSGYTAKPVYRIQYRDQP
jgi:hypothetical protein